MLASLFLNGCISDELLNKIINEYPGLIHIFLISAVIGTNIEGAIDDEVKKLGSDSSPEEKAQAKARVIEEYKQMMSEMIFNHFLFGS